MKTVYREQARRAQRWFSLKGDHIKIDGRDRGRKFCRDFCLSELSASTQHFVALRQDMMWRCLSLTLFAALLGVIIGRTDIPFAIVVFGLSMLLVAKFAWMALGWALKKEEVEIFSHLSGGEAFVIFNDKPGDSEFTEFVEQIKSSIADASKKGAQPDGTDNSGAAPLRV